MITAEFAAYSENLLSFVVVVSVVVVVSGWLIKGAVRPRIRKMFVRIHDVTQMFMILSGRGSQLIRPDSLR